MQKSNNCQQLSELITGYLDGELTQQDSQRVSLHLQSCETCKSSFEELQAMQKLIKQSKYPNMDESQLKHVVNDLTSKKLELISWVAIVSGFVFVLVLAGYEFWIDTSLSGFEKFTVGLLIAGGVGLFLSVLRQRLKNRKNDKYRGVKL